jgi:hypothetical protein
VLQPHLVKTFRELIGLLVAAVVKLAQAVTEAAVRM